MNKGHLVIRAVFCECDVHSPIYISFVFFAGERLLEHPKLGCGPQVVVAELVLMFRHMCRFVQDCQCKLLMVPKAARLARGCMVW